MSETASLTTMFEAMEQAPVKVACQKVLLFTLDEQHFAVDIADAKEVLEMTPATKIPYAPGFVIGAMNLRGEILAVLDIRDLVGLPQSKRMDDAKVIVTDVTGSSVGLLADSVLGTLDIPEDQIQIPLLTLDDIAQSHMKGQVQLDDHILVLLDLRALLNCDAVNRLRGVHGDT